MAALTDIEFLPYLDQTGNISPDLVGKIGVYAIFDSDRQLQYVGISRDIAVSLKLHIVRVPSLCHWLKIETIAKPSRTALLEIQAAWQASCANTDHELWEQPLNCLRWITDAEKAAYENTMNEAEQEKVLKNLARRIEQDILQQLASRGVGFEVRFNPKLKGQGILDLKP
ncbi:hypothetical protein Syn7502_02071 [Synechococcus sp. PCC 7502]|uniref:GIY-YIG nuclease family protein n=1 Tax=Synechococcus sp. PCC 7502 TaxID=1173263 RepID=UPI00029FAEB2|nr:GIY-YIG nuclease family protein [Synechococcus sp. PCC 7502]AFY74092.1 hypothetical protein Syn7502_02071 [Synechococcus sp. PCC 7502]